jgi:glycosyltransferase involved in cell wall biosynthesis
VGRRASRALRGGVVLKLSLLIPWFLPVSGGAEHGAFRLAHRLTARGHAVSVVTPQLRPEWPLHESMDGVDVHRFPVASFGRRDWTTAVVLASFRQLGRLWRRLAPDVINQHYLLPTGIAGQWWARRLGIPTVTTLIGMDVYDPDYRPGPHWRALMRRAIRGAQGVTCISSFVRDVVQRDYPPAPGVSCQLVPYGVDIKQFHPHDGAGEIRRRHGLAESDTLIVTVQRLWPRKGVTTFLDAAAIVARTIPSARFLVVGDGPERAALERQARAAGMGDRVTFVGRKDNLTELPAYYAAADVFAFHTLHEGLGIVLLEALASGCAVVTTAAGGTIDIVRDGDTGLLVPPGDARAFAEAVIRLLRDAPLKVALRARARRTAETEYDWDVVAGRYLEAFEAARRSGVR